MAKQAQSRKVTPQRYPSELLMELLTSLGDVMGHDDNHPLRRVSALVGDVWLDLHGDKKSVAETDADLNWKTALIACALMTRVPGVKKKFAVAACIGKDVPAARVAVIEKYVQQLRSGSNAKALAVRQWAIDDALYRWAEARLTKALEARSTGKKRA